MFSLEIENIEKWIRENHPGMAEDKWRLADAAWAVHDSMPWHAHTGMYCNGEQVYWERDPYRRVWSAPSAAKPNVTRATSTAVRKPPARSSTGRQSKDAYTP